MRNSVCIVPGCGSRKKENPNLTFFCLPRNPKLVKQWASNLNISHIIHNKTEGALTHIRVCALHFQENSFRTPLKAKLNIRAMPFKHVAEENENNNSQGTSPEIVLEEVEPESIFQSTTCEEEYAPDPLQVVLEDSLPKSLKNVEELLSPLMNISHYSKKNVKVYKGLKRNTPEPNRVKDDLLKKKLKVNEEDVNNLNIQFDGSLVKLLKISNNYLNEIQELKEEMERNKEKWEKQKLKMINKIEILEKIIEIQKKSS